MHKVILLSCLEQDELSQREGEKWPCAVAPIAEERTKECEQHRGREIWGEGVLESGQTCQGQKENET